MTNNLASTLLQSVPNLPARGQEFWKYSPLKELYAPAWVLADKTASPKANVMASLPEGFHALVFVNGVYQEKLSHKAVGEIKVLQQPTESFTKNEGLLQSSRKESEAGFEKLNEQHAQAQYLIQIPAQTKVTKPVALCFVSSGVNTIALPRLQVQVGEGSVVEFVEQSISSELTFSNSVIDVHVGPAAKVSWLRLQNESAQSFNLGQSVFHLQRQSTLNSLSVSVGARWSRHYLSILLQQPEAFAQVDGIYVAGSTDCPEQQVEHYTNIDHIVGECNSYQHYKGIVGQSGRGVFNGRVHINKGAAKANSSQLNNTLLMSTKAEIDAKPQLEIWADDVKATHGSTVGQLDPEQLFYLESRAIDKVQAQQLLAQAHILEPVLKIENKVVRDFVLAQLQSCLQTVSVPS